MIKSVASAGVAGKSMNGAHSLREGPRRSSFDGTFWVRFRFACLAATLVLAAEAAQAKDVVRVGGTGIGLAFSRIAGDHLMAIDDSIQTEVFPSLGTPGGLKALAAGDLDVAITARPLSEGERTKGFREAACMTTALVFATSRPAAPGIKLAELPEIYSDPSPRWPDGQPLKIILRAAAGSENPYLVKLVPGMEAALAAAFRRPGIPIGATDQENADLAQRMAGSFAIMTLMQIRSERLEMTPLPVNGVTPSAATLAERSYPMPLPLCYVLPVSPAQGALRFVAFMRSTAGRELARLHGGEPTE